MVDVTLLEVNLEGADFKANAPFSGSEGKSLSGSKLSKMLPGASSKGEKSKSKKSEDDDESADPVELDIEDAAEGAGDDSSPSLAPIVALAVLVVAVLVIKKLRGGNADSQQDLEDFE